MAASDARPSYRRPKRGTRGGRLDSGRINLRLSAEEMRRARTKAEAAGLAVTTYARAAVTGTVGHVAQRQMSVDVAALGKLQAALGHIGSNLNQIARSLNQGDATSTRVIDAALAEHRALVQQVSALLRSEVGP